MLGLPSPYLHAFSIHEERDRYRGRGLVLSQHFPFESADAPALRKAHTKGMCELSAVIRGHRPIHQAILARLFSINVVVMDLDQVFRNAVLQQVQKRRYPVLPPLNITTYRSYESTSMGSVCAFD